MSDEPLYSDLVGVGQEKRSQAQAPDPWGAISAEQRQWAREDPGFQAMLASIEEDQRRASQARLAPVVAAADAHLLAWHQVAAAHVELERTAAAMKKAAGDAGVDVTAHMPANILWPGGTLRALDAAAVVERRVRQDLKDAK